MDVVRDTTQRQVTSTALVREVVARAPTDRFVARDESPRATSNVTLFRQVNR